MKKILLTLLAITVVVGALVGAGYAGYRIGYNNSATGSGDGHAFGRFSHMDPDQMPMQNFGRGFDKDSRQEFSFYQHPMMSPGGFNTMGRGHFSPFFLLWHIAIIGLIIWFAYWLFTKSGWQITRKMEPVLKSDSAE